MSFPLFTGFSTENAFRKTGTNPKNHSTNLSNFSYEESGDDDQVQRQEAGRNADIQSIGAVLTRTLSITTQVFNFETLGLILNEEKKTFTGISQPTYREVLVPAGGGTVVAPGLTAANLAMASFAYNGGPAGQVGQLSKVTVAPTTAGSVRPTAGNIEFAAADAGCVVGYFYDQAITSAVGYGGAGATTSLGQLEFYGAIYERLSGATGMLLWLPQVERQSAFTVEMAGSGVPEIQIQYKVTTPTGWDKAFRMLNAKTMVI
jgi:hypothetical protein